MMMHALSRRAVVCSYSVCITRAGQSVRISRGQGRSGNEDGPLHDMPDFHFADGRPSPVTTKMQKWMWKRENDKQKLGDVRNSAQKHNSKLDQLREEQFTDQKKKWNLKREVKQLIHEEINRVEEARKEEREEEALIKEAAAKDLVEPEYYGRKLSRTQAEFLAKRQAQQQASKGQKSAKAEEGEKKKEETDAPAKKKRVKGVKKE